MAQTLKPLLKKPVFGRPQNNCNWNIEMSTNAQVRQQKSPPWYKVGMVWVMIGLPAIVVVAALCTAVIAHKNAPEITTQSRAQ